MDGCESSFAKVRTTAQVAEGHPRGFAPVVEGQLASIQDRLDFEVRRLREEAQDREIAFTKALSQRPKGEEILRDIAHATKNFEALFHSSSGSTADVLQGMNARVCRLEEHCSRRCRSIGSTCSNPEVDLEPSDQLDGGLGSPDKDICSSPEKESRVLTVLDLGERLREHCRRCDEQEGKITELENRINYILGSDRETQDGNRESPRLVQLPALMERVDCLATALAHLDSGTQESLDRERREREVLNRVLSERLAQEIADRTAVMSGLREEVEHFRMPPSQTSVRASSPPVQYHVKQMGNSVEAHVVRDPAHHAVSPPASSPEPLQPQPSLDSYFGKVSGFSSPQRNGAMLNPNTSPRHRCPPCVSWKRNNAQAVSPRRQTSQALAQDPPLAAELLLTLAEKRKMLEQFRDTKTTSAQNSRPADRNALQRSPVAGTSSVTRSASQPQGPGVQRLSQPQVSVLVANPSASGSCGQALQWHDGVTPLSPQVYPVRTATLGTV